MELDGLLVSTKWDLLVRIAKEPKSPMQLAEEIGTSIANVSQQLRFLELAGIVTKTRVPNRDRGKPRKIYSLSRDFAYIVILSKSQQEKRAIALDEHLRQKLNTLLKGAGP